MITPSTFLQELFDYNRSVNKALIDVLTQHPEQVSEKCLKLFSHILNAHRIWNYRIGKKPGAFASWHLHRLDQLQAIDTANHNDTQRILTDIDPEQVIEYTTARGDVFRHRVRDLLFQALNHATYHRGQLASEFRQMGLEPLVTDYIFYKMQGN